MVEVSVIVPVYKVPLEYLRECFDSLLAQTMQDCEFIVVSDGAPEAECSVCDEYVAKDLRFKFFRREHAGVSATRNYGIEQAQGEFITFVDSDDSLSNPEILSATKRWQKENSSDVIICDWDEHKLWPTEKKLLTKDEIIFCLKNCIFNQDSSFSAAPWAKFFNRQFLLSNNILFREKCSIGEDRIFNYEAISKASSISYYNKAIYQYHINNSSTTQKFHDNIFPILLEYLKELNKIISKDFRAYIGSETIRVFYKSWDLCYMHSQNKKKLAYRVANLKSILASDEFNVLTNEIYFKSFSPLIRAEIVLYKKKIFLPLWLHGIKHLLFK